MANQQSESESKGDATAQAAHETNANMADVPPASSASAAPRSGRALAWFALLLAALALAAGGYLWEQQRSVVRALIADDARRAAAVDGFDDAIAQLETRIAAAEQSAKQSKDDLDDLSAQLDALREQLQTTTQTQSDANASQATQATLTEQARQIESLRGAVARLSDRIGGGAARWHLREAEQLLVIANQQLQWSSNVELARYALQLADGNLRQIYDPALAPVRAHLAAELVALDRVREVDVAGTLNALAALADGVESLPLAGDALLAPPSVADAESNEDIKVVEDDTKSWWQLGEALLDDLSALVQIETEGVPELVIEDELRWMIFERARLMLEASQLAFLRARDDVYAARMAAARGFIVARFDATAPSTIAWLRRFDEIAAVAPSPNLPDISASLRALREVLQQSTQ